MAFKDPGLFRDPSYFHSLCANLSPSSLGAPLAWQGLEANAAVEEEKCAGKRDPGK